MLNYIIAIRVLKALRLEYNQSNYGVMKLKYRKLRSKIELMNVVCESLGENIEALG